MDSDKSHEVSMLLGYLEPRLAAASSRYEMALANLNQKVRTNLPISDFELDEMNRSDKLLLFLENEKIRLESEQKSLSVPVGSER